MFIEESLWIKSVLGSLDLPSGSAVLNLGSSTAQFRQLTQPHIENNVFKPLREKGYQINHLDAKQGNGVDIVCDINDPNVDFIDLIGRQFDLVICSNLLEHVLDVNRVARRAADFVKDRGYLLVTVPRSYRNHPDPIDTMFRPAVRELEELFRSSEPAMVTAAARVCIISHRMYYPVYKSRLPFWGYRDLLRYLFPWARWKVSCVLFQKVLKGKLMTTPHQNRKIEQGIR